MYKEFYLEIYNRTFLFVTEQTSDEINDYLDKTYEIKPTDHYDWADCAGCAEKVTGKDVNVIVIFVHDPKDAGTIHHEVVHAATHVCQIVGIKHDFENEEPYTYLVGWIGKKISEALYEHNAK